MVRVLESKVLRENRVLRECCGFRRRREEAMGKAG
jgi:hypothetical protein